MVWVKLFNHPAKYSMLDSAPFQSFESVVVLKTEKGIKLYSFSFNFCVLSQTKLRNYCLLYILPTAHSHQEMHI